jgi:hypothetical protein
MRSQNLDVVSPELARVVAKWERLPEHVRHVILALVDGA